MQPLHLISYLFGGAFFMNAMPHLVAGLMGQRFPSPFATPPGEGLSSSLVNLVWGFGNLAAAYFLLCRVGVFDLRRASDILALSLGMFMLGFPLAWHFGRLNGGRGPGS